MTGAPAAPKRRAVRTHAAPAPVGPYSQAVSAGAWVFVSGQIPMDPRTGGLVEGDIEAQAERALENLGAVLAAAGLSFDAVVRTTVYLSDLAHFPRLNEVYGRYFRADPKPARTTLQAAKLPLGALVEIDAIALREGSQALSGAAGSDDA